MTTLEERVAALEERECYDDTDLKEKLGYNIIPQNNNLQAEIDSIKDILNGTFKEDTIYYMNTYKLQNGGMQADMSMSFKKKDEFDNFIIMNPIKIIKNGEDVTESFLPSLEGIDFCLPKFCPLDKNALFMVFIKMENSSGVREIGLMGRISENNILPQVTTQ